VKSATEWDALLVLGSIVSSQITIDRSVTEKSEVTKPESA
jgi:hypothetical protein